MQRLEKMRVLITEEEVEVITYLLKWTIVPIQKAKSIVRDLLKRRKDTKTTDAYVEAAKAVHQNDGTLEIDDGAAVSMGSDPGAYVQAWVWVTKADMLEHRQKAVKERSKKLVKQGSVG